MSAIQSYRRTGSIVVGENMFHEVLGLKVKNCPRCTRLLCDDAFWLNASMPDGHSAYCKSCDHARDKERKTSTKTDTPLFESAGIDKGVS
jgi:hypothetical protein